eukprot:TRINITY_DN1715_c0_g1_i2.p1 TRINITY_DN1715_c0_g1~~TRINITY_DN1715_c0_g1_i2.p1  ORF type:complete len:1866 (-),score=308.01 TRINITY_DN1715_c0_g1_i2:397-5517(-)
MSWSCLDDWWISYKLCQQTCYDEGYGYENDDCSAGWPSLDYTGYICSVRSEAVGSWVRLSLYENCQSSFLHLPNPGVWMRSPSAEMIQNLDFQVFKPRILLLQKSPSQCNLPPFIRSDWEVAGRFYRLESRLELLQNTLDAPASSGSWSGGQCPSVAKTFLNEKGCKLLPGCLPLGSQNVHFELTATNLAKFFTIGGRYVYAVTGLRPSASPCGVLSRWKKLDCNTDTCVVTSLPAADADTIVNTLQSEVAQGWLRDVQPSCAAASVAAGSVVQVGSDFFKHVHLDEYNVFDFSDWVVAHPGGRDKIKQWTSKGYILEFPSWHPMDRWESGPAPGAIRPGFVGKFQASISYESLPQPLQTADLATALGAQSLQGAADFSEVCGSPGEVANEPAEGYHFSFYHGPDDFDEFFDFVSENYWNHDKRGKTTVWLAKALHAKDQLRQRVAWALSQIFVVSDSIGREERIEMWVNYYDIFVRNAFGNYRDVLREVTYSPVMGDYLTFKRNRAFDFTNNYPDENYAREIMQLFSIGLWKLNPDGSRKKDADGNDIQTYTNEHITSFARVLTGFDHQSRRGNIEDTGSSNFIDPMRMKADWHDVYPKPNLDGGFLGDGYPLCSDLPAGAFLEKGAVYEFLGHSTDAKGIYTLDQASSLFGVLCANSSLGLCNYNLTVALPAVLPCHGSECQMDTVDVLNVSGAYYQYIPPTCVNLYFFNGRVTRKGGRTYGWSEKCHDPLIPYYAGTSCCGGCRNVATGNMKKRFRSCENATVTWPSMFTNYCKFNENWRVKKFCQKACYDNGVGYDGDDHPNLCPNGDYRALHICAYPMETVKLATAEQQCHSQGLELCYEKQEGLSCIYDDERVWTQEICTYEVVVHADGEVSSNWTSQSLQNKFAAVWSNGYPKVIDGVCPTGCVAVGESCSCSMTVVTQKVFNQIPSPADVMSRLKIGAYAPRHQCTMNCAGEVKVYAQNSSVFDQSTVFEYKGAFYKNEEVLVQAGANHTFRNPPAFMLTDFPSERQALAEVESLLDHLFHHENTPVFVGYRLIQRLTSSNPSPGYLQAVTDAFRTGNYPGITSSGVYGDLGATVAAVLLHPEAQNQGSETNGALREPLIKILHFMRAMDYRDQSGRNVMMENLQDRIGQFPYQSPTVFNFYLPEYSPDGFPSGLVGPEFEIFTPPTAIRFANGMTSLMDHGLGRCDGGFGVHSSNCANGRTHLGESECLHQTIDKLDLLLTGGRLTNKEMIRQAYKDAEGEDQYKAAQMAMVMTPEFHTLGAPLPNGPREVPPETVVADPRSYKAMIMLFLGGGADTFNMLVPMNCPLYDEYHEVRKTVALLPGQLHRIATVGQNCSDFGIHDKLPFLKELYDAKEAAFISNIGSLVEPLTKTEFKKGGGARCAGLFSHSDQQRAAQTLTCQSATASSKGAGGRIADALASGSQNFRTHSFSVAGTSTWPQGMETKAEIIDRDSGTVRFEKYKQLKTVIDNITSVKHGNIYCDEYAQQLSQAIKFNEELGKTLQNAELKTGYPTEDIGLSRQLKQVARLIAARGERKAERDFFFVQIGGFDTHQSVATELNDKFTQVNSALKSFVEELKEQQVFDSTVLVSHSDFGRTLTPNSGLGTDHAWAGNHFILGGDVQGGRVYNDFPSSFKEGNDQDAGRGRLIPKYPWESMILPVAEWLGLDAAKQLEVFPNLLNFNASSHIIQRSSLFKS